MMNHACPAESIAMNARSTVRSPAVAGLFYPQDANELRAAVGEMLAGARACLAQRPKVLIAPHAGYVYSGPVAAAAYVELHERAAEIDRVVLLGPAHRVALRGVGVASVDEFATPLGPIPVDDAARAQVLELPGVMLNDAAHAEEHSLEVHLPFLQAVLRDFALLPLVVGDASPEQVAQVLDAVWGGDDTLIVISTDLSHFHDYQSARRIDADTVAQIEAQVNTIAPQQACGCRPLNGLLTVTRRRGMQIVTLDARNSGDTAGSHDRVVGYAAFAATG